MSKQPAVGRRTMSADESDAYDFDTRRDASQRVRRFCARLVLRRASRRFIPESSFEAVTFLPFWKRPG